ncbi:DUF4365 domain-containing protein [Flavobacterium lindanitolerans]|uniref:DUF4365 domain-containing protein n=1 Tax=Flavobacterium lindanitolerans TaxID=428988 RepID=UPI0031DF57A5
MTREEFDKQSLPKSDANVNLETFSRNRLRAMFNVEDFEIRDELQHDKGVDLFIEIKRNGNSTNLRFAIQLKATNSLAKNKDGSISYSIQIANLNYLLNDGFPAFYILYNKQEDTFYYERVQDIEAKLREKYKDTALPQSYTIKFKKLLDRNTIDSLRSEILSRGYLRRALNKELKLSEDGKELKQSIVIQEDQNIYSPKENIKFLERYGYILLNDGRFSEILDIEKKCHPAENTSASFHFICGTAAHYKGLHYDALRHFKMADKASNQLHTETNNMILYYRTHSKLNLGIINKDQSMGYMEALLDSDYLGLFLRLQKAFETWYISRDKASEKLARFHKEVDSVLSSPHCSESIKTTAESYVLSVEGHRINDQLLDDLIKFRDSMGMYSIGPDAIKKREEQIIKYNQHFAELKSKAQKDRNRFTYYAVCLNGIKILYTRTFYVHIILGMNTSTLTVTSTLSSEDKELLKEQAADTGQIALAYEEIGVSDNLIAALSQQYELLHFAGNFEEAASVLKNMEKLISDNEWHGLESKIAYLKNGGTSHEQFTEMVISNIYKAKERERQHDILRSEIEQMDIEDQEKKLSITGEKVYLQIFPLGNFCLPKENMNVIFDALNVSDIAKERILNVMGIGVKPILNAFRNPIVTEGPDGGFSAERVTGSLERIHKVRKDLRELGAYKI